MISAAVGVDRDGMRLQETWGTLGEISEARLGCRFIRRGDVLFGIVLGAWLC